MSETVIPIASTPSTRAGCCSARTWGTARSNDSTQTTNTPWGTRCGRKRDFICRLPAHRKFPLLLGVPFVFRIRYSQALHQVVADPQSIRHDGERRVHGCARWKETSIDHIEVVKIVRFAVRVEHRTLRIVSKANRAVLMGHTGERNSLSDVQVSAKQSLMTLVAVYRAIRLLHRLLQLALKPLVCLQVVRRVRQNDLAVAADGDSIVRIGQVFGREPEVQRVC